MLVWMARCGSCVPTAKAPKIGRITATGNVTMYVMPGTRVHNAVGDPVLVLDIAIWFGYQDSIVAVLDESGTKALTG